MTSDKGETPRELGVAWEASPELRQYHADGVFGGLTPKGHIYMSFFAERPPYPKASRLIIGAQGRPSSDTPVRSDNEPVLVREVQASVYLEYDVARAINQWLSRQIELLEAALGIASEEGSE